MSPELRRSLNVTYPLNDILEHRNSFWGRFIKFTIQFAEWRFSADISIARVATASVTASR